jgi:hypothetical protein
MTTYTNLNLLPSLAYTNTVQLDPIFSHHHILLLWRPPGNSLAKVVRRYRTYLPFPMADCEIICPLGVDVLTKSMRM